jgi:hypothetical protein
MVQKRHWCSGFNNPIIWKKAVPFVDGFFFLGVIGYAAKAQML